MEKITNSKTFKIRDLRRKDKYSIDDEYLNGYAKLCGVFGTAVYNSLCRHASKDQECFPSIELIAEQHNIGRSSVLRGLKKLKEWKIILVKKEKDEKTKRQKNNVYVLLDKSQWNPKPSITQTLGNNDPSISQKLGAGFPTDAEPGFPQNQSRVSDRDCKDTHIKDSHIRDGADAPARICLKEGCKNKPMRGVDFCEEHQPMNCQQFIDWYQKSDQRHIKIIADFVDELRIAGVAPDLRTVAQWREFVHPFRATATKLSVFDDDQLASAMKRMMAAKWVTDFNLYTLKKFLINSNK
jgi:hypothetical protein